MIGVNKCKTSVVGITSDYFMFLCDATGMGGNRSAVSNAQLQQLHEKLHQQNDGTIPLNFMPTAPGHDPSAPNAKGCMPRQSPRNPQTEQFLDMLGLPYNLEQQSRQVPAAAPLSRCHLLNAIIVAHSVSSTA